MSSIANTRAIAILVIGDIVVYIFSLILTLAFRYGQIPTKDLLSNHISSFAILIAIFILINFSAGLYEKMSSVIRGRIHGSLFRAQLMNVLIGIAFFYFAPVAIAPKANLFIYIAISTALLFLWRVAVFPVVSVARRQNAILIGSGEDIEDLHTEISKHVRYGLNFSELISPKSSTELTVTEIKNAVSRTNASMVVINIHDPLIESAMPFLYSLIFSGVQIIDANKLYEIIFDRIPLSMVRERWFIENSSTALGSRRVYDGLKRFIDIILATLLGIISLIVYPFIFLAIRLDDKGPLFISQERVGKKGKIIKIYKFRSMSGNDNGKYGSNGTTTLQVTRVGKFIRTSRIDELPQFWNVIKGDLSLVGPRPEIPSLVNVYDKDIPYYNARHLVKPGLSGWAQIYHEAHPHHAIATEDTKDKLAYDLYYIKNRSLTLDIKIALRTLQILLKRVGK